MTDSSGGQYNATLWSANPAADLAILNVADARSNHWASFATDSDWVEVGEKVYIYGNPLGIEGTFTDGMLSAVRNNGAMLQISAPLDRGSSGSPVFDAYGKVIGIDDLVMAEGAAELNLAISSNVIIEAQKLKNADHPNGFNIGVTTDLELRSPEQIDADNAAIKSAKTTSAIRDAFEQILADVKAFSPDKTAAYAWTVTMRDYGAWSEQLTADYWLSQVIRRYPNPDDQARLLADVNALLKLQGHNPLSPSDDQIREQNEKALQQQPSPTPSAPTSIYDPAANTGYSDLSAVTQNQPLKVEIKGFKTSHSLEQKTAPQDRADAGPMGHVERPH